ncbi:MAG: sigma-70 family RNA polymerase sigma factor [Armatimonadetes bacterium]|nr:MAG: sigma-70 family RNA polymerase sigma factor [Armatimonadota bacterium]
MTLSPSRGVGDERRLCPADEDPRSDAQLLQESENDPAAFSVLYRRWADRILSYFYRRTWDGEAAADLTAETFAIAFTKRKRYVRSAAPGGAWLYGIASNELRRHRRRHRTEKRALRRLGVEVPRLDDASLQRIEDLDEVRSFRRQLVAALAELSTAERDAVRLRIVDELSFREVAHNLGCSEGAARVRVHRALSRLSTSMEADRE